MELPAKITLLKQGAEARLYTREYLGRPAIVKERFKKKYRHPDLDASLTKERIKNEARAIARCKTARVKTPTLYLIDFNRRSIFMQYFENAITIKDFIINYMKIDNDKSLLKTIAKKIGETVRKMHDNNIIHGDLTTSNMLLLKEGEEVKINDKTDVIMIDFGLSRVESSNEDKAVDLYVLERALISTHNDVPDLFNVILESYKNYNKNKVNEIISKFEEVRARGRKRTMVG